MKFNDIIGQEHLQRVVPLVIAQKPKIVLITGPLGCGKSTLARIIAGGIGGSGEESRWVMDSLEESWTIIDNSDLKRDDWSRLIQMSDSSKDHTVILVVEDLDKVPKSVQSRSVRIHLRPMSRENLLAFSENLLVASKIPYTQEGLEALIEYAERDVRQVVPVLEMAGIRGSLDTEMVRDLGPDPTATAKEIFSNLVDGYTPEAKRSADSLCDYHSINSLALAMLNLLSLAFSPTPSEPLLGRIKTRFPLCGKTSDVLLKWIGNKIPCGSKVGSVFIEELNATGTRIEDPRVVEQRRVEEEANASKMLRGRPELNLDPLAMSNRSNPNIPIWEDKSIPMDPRTRAKLKLEAEELARKELKKAHRVPSSVISEDAVNDSNPLGIRMPPPGIIPKGVILGSQFSKLTKAKKLSPEEKWDAVYAEKRYNERLRAFVIERSKELGGSVLVENPLEMQVIFPVEAVDGDQLGFNFEEVTRC